MWRHANKDMTTPTDSEALPPTAGSPSLGSKRYSSVKEMDRMTAGHFHPENKKCPECGATLLKNLEGDEWCSLVTCGFGIEENAEAQQPAPEKTL